MDLSAVGGEKQSQDEKRHGRSPAKDIQNIWATPSVYGQALSTFQVGFSPFVNPQIQRGIDVINGGAVGNVEQGMLEVVLAINDLTKDWRSGVDNNANREEVKRWSLKLMEMTKGGDNTIENFPQFALILETLKVLDYSDCEQLRGK